MSDRRIQDNRQSQEVEKIQPDKWKKIQGQKQIAQRFYATSAAEYLQKLEQNGEYSSLIHSQPDQKLSEILSNLSYPINIQPAAFHIIS